MAEGNTSPIRCTSMVFPTRDSAYLSITLLDGSTHKYDLTFSQLRLFNSQTAEAIANWPVEEKQPA